MNLCIFISCINKNLMSCYLPMKNRCPPSAERETVHCLPKCPCEHPSMEGDFDKQCWYGRPCLTREFCAVCVKDFPSLRLAENRNQCRSNKPLEEILEHEHHWFKYR